MELTNAQLETLGELADTADNYAAAAGLQLPAATHKERLEEGMRRLRDQLRHLYREISGNDPWEL